MRKRIDISGQQFGLLTVKEYSDNGRWYCECRCGAITRVGGSDLRAGKSKSCGACGRLGEKNPNYRHGKAMKGEPANAYGSWSSMISRCCDKNHPDYGYYGGRGITVCDRWKDFRAFLADMGERPQGLTIERIDNNKGYSPENCVWATRKAQANNTRRNNVIEYRGEAKTLKQWAEHTGIHWATILDRLTRGWSVERALAHPVRQREKAVGKLYEYQGKEKTLTEWAKDIGIRPGTLSARMRRLGMTVAEAIELGKGETIARQKSR